MATLPTDAKTRKAIPLVAGLLDYFPAALAAVAEVSRVGNEQHNPGQPLHHNRGKSTDHADCIVRHLMDRGAKDSDGLRHTAKVAWRALALLQEELEAAGEAPLARGARLPTNDPAVALPVGWKEETPPVIMGLGGPGLSGVAHTNEVPCPGCTADRIEYVRRRKPASFNIRMAAEHLKHGLTAPAQPIDCAACINAALDGCSW